MRSCLLIILLCWLTLTASCAPLPARPPADGPWVGLPETGPPGGSGAEAWGWGVATALAAVAAAAAAKAWWRWRARQHGDAELAALQKALDLVEALQLRLERRRKKLAFTPRHRHRQRAAAGIAGRVRSSFKSWLTRSRR